MCSFMILTHTHTHRTLTSPFFIVIKTAGAHTVRFCLRPGQEEAGPGGGTGVTANQAC